jgi:prepilin signal peptidase PulO-like enzyme (type II secretory pathway)
LNATAGLLVLGTAAAYGGAAVLALLGAARLCDGIVPFEDGPVPGRPPVAGLVIGAALCGAALAVRTAGVPALAVDGLVIVALAACWYCDARTGIVPDLFTLLPLAIVFAVACVARDPAPFVSAAVVFVPFACAALFSNGRGMGWGDVKLVALGAAVLPLSNALLALTAACAAAAIVAAIRRRRTEPIAFAPYLSGALALTLAVPVFPR